MLLNAGLSELGDLNEIEALLDLSDLVRGHISNNNIAGICEIITYVTDHGYFEALSWVLELLQEEFDKGDGCHLSDFCCEIGRKINNYDGFINGLQAESKVLSQEVEYDYDETGEVRAFSYISTYRTKYDSIFLLSSEKFDTVDRDYIQYKLSFRRVQSK